MKLRKIGLLLLLVWLSAGLRAGSLDEIRQALELSSGLQVQEKVYIHTDNTCYFVGDTLWYKAYVVRADNLHQTDMSRILYVELLSPDGMLVERQNIIVSPKGFTCGQFCLKDSLYSGYYELRAYTRWMLNFNQGHHRFNRQETWWFYNSQMALDYFRTWDGLYSRVLPVYSKPETVGDYDARRMYQRPKTRIQKPKKDELLVNFYPEGGHLVEGLPCSVAFEATDQNGEAVNVRGAIMAGDEKVADAVVRHMGRGSFSVTPGAKRLKAQFVWRGKTYTFSLPKAEAAGVAIALRDNQLSVAAKGLDTTSEYGLAVLCRGTLQHFQTLQLNGTVSLPVEKLPTGVNDMVVFDAQRGILADRLFFVNHQEQARNVITSTISPTHTYAPYEQISVPVSLPDVSEPTRFSLAIRDTRTEEPTYNDGNIMTDLLLSSELRGFIAKPAYYFEADDADHRANLDLLMQVQGWRKYKWQELSDTAYNHRRYKPETTMTVEGGVYKMLGVPEVDPEEISSWVNGVGKTGVKEKMEEESQASESEDDGFYTTDQMTTDTQTADASSIEYGSLSSANDELGIEHGMPKREVLVEAELILDDQIVGSVQKTHGGRFVFEIPPFYGDAYLNVKAYRETDSIKKNMASRKDKYVISEDAYPDFFVKRDLIYPVFTNDYNFYQKNAPDYEVLTVVDTLSELSMENDVHMLGNVNVKGRRRGRRAIDYTKPAYVCDAYELYNDITDRGLSFGKYDMRQFPVQVCKFLFGNMGRYNMYNVDGRLNGQVFYRNYNDIPDGSELVLASKRWNNRSPYAIYDNLKLKRLQDIRVFTDYEPRTEDSTMVQDQYSADATVEFVPIPDDGKQVTYRDRHFVFHGFNMPEKFYQPNYGNRQPSQPADYRRTLYWNPNAVTDAEGNFTATFYNNSKETRIKMSAAGVTSDGRLMHSK